ncbi:hypothetical protein [Roseofilum capinflatum]|uniref:Wzt C-terminal domain-containing protein n=1 Tax=Roseofilum capinflatum BLCC-M114 TaxID=3022440 RepID=A0ABT7B059_9CYAN|nr:hypothetical protein [Roseofilum capinflatum]MDJ1172548.1 hypothetical protein [Roseofilum capinflatum BLCC-M114]
MNENNFIEVDGIRFETLVPKRVLTLPKKNLIQKLSDLGKHLLKPPLHPSPGYPVEIGIRITNNSDRPLYFTFNFVLFPELIKAETGEIVEVSGGWISLSGVKEPDLALTMPGESTSFFIDAKICWICGKNYGLSMVISGGEFVFEPLDLGWYQLRFRYQNQKGTKQLYDSIIKKTQVIEGFWIGQVLTPFVDIWFVNS